MPEIVLPCTGCSAATGPWSHASNLILQAVTGSGNRGGARAKAAQSRRVR